MLKTVVVIMLCVFASSLASALDCNNAITQGDMNECEEIELDKASLKLKELQDILANRLIDSEKGDFIKSNDMWQSYRDQQCNAVGDLFIGGSIRPLMIFACKTRLTIQRIEFIQNFYSYRMM